MKKILLTAICALLRNSGESHASPVQWSTGSAGNGHVYEIVLAPPAGITWADAQADALSRGGYLATLTSALENSFVYNSLVNDNTYWHVGSSFTIGPWIGGMQPLGSLEPAGGFEWINGEGPFDYANWNPGEPNNANGEDRVQFFTGASSGPSPLWNDAGNTATAPSYVIEFSVPEPSSLAITLTAGLAIVSLARRRIT
ncbi:MAG: C-type lectin domain-containing protein [Aeoliella sp.]